MNIITFTWGISTVFTWFVAGALIVFALLYWFFFILPRREKDKARAITLAKHQAGYYATNVQKRPIEPESHMTGRAYGALLRMAHGDRQKVEYWIVEAQRLRPGCSRVEAIEWLAERSRSKDSMPA